jgi:L-arabinonolactonase
MAANEFELVDIVKVGNTLGEGVSWDHVRACAWWTDIEERRLYRYDPQSKALDRFELPERLGSFGFIDGSDALIAAFESGFAIYEPASRQVEWVARPPHDSHNIRFNDGRVDRQGRFWAGSMVQGRGEPKGKLYCLRGRHLSAHLTGIAISNSLSFSPDGSALYFADTPHRAIHRYDLDPHSGTISNRQVFAQTPPGAFPDGSTVDREGHLWNAQWGSGRVVRYAPDGSVSASIDVPASQVSCVAIGGRSFELLFVTSARTELTQERLDKEPGAGDLFVYKGDFRGLPEPRFRQ